MRRGQGYGRRTWIQRVVTGAFTLALVPVASADEQSRGESADRHTDPSDYHRGECTRTSSREPWVSVNLDIGGDEKLIIREHWGKVKTEEEGGRGRSKKASRQHGHDLPPGLSKKVARGGSLPPGWQKKCERGQMIPTEIFEHCRPLPPEVVAKLPPGPPGTVIVTIEGKVARILKATREVLDVFDVKI